MDKLIFELICLLGSVCRPSKFFREFQGVRVSKIIFSFRCLLATTTLATTIWPTAYRVLMPKIHVRLCVFTLATNEWFRLCAIHWVLLWIVFFYIQVVAIFSHMYLKINSARDFVIVLPQVDKILFVMPFVDVISRNFCCFLSVHMRMCYTFKFLRFFSFSIDVFSQQSKERINRT